jgi:type I restriction enzyme S subunit
MGTQLNLNTDTVGSILIGLPPLDEQDEIVKFLDFKTAQIDALIAKKKALLDKLSEKRTALISHAVTKGLDPLVPMKDSEVAWLGKIPAHWDVKRLKFCLSIQNGRDHKDVQATDGYPVYGSGGRFTYATQFLHDGEAVLLGRKGTIDRPLYVNEAFWTVDTMYYAIPKDGCNGKFAYYCATLIPFNFYSTDTALPSMTQGSLNNHVFAIPPINEQQDIVDYINNLNKKIDLQIWKATEVIVKLTEYRSALITNAVTGKIDVRSFDTPVPQDQ